MIFFRVAFAAAGCLAAGQALAAPAVKIGPDAFGDWRQDSPGVRRLIRPEDLPSPSPEQSASQPAMPVKMPDGAKVMLPDNFTAERVASGLTNPRALRIAPNGDIFVADSKANRIVTYRLAEGSAKIEQEAVFATGLHKPYGIAFYPPGPDPQWVYVGNSNGVVRFKYKNGDLKAGSKEENIVENIPEAHHWTRDVVFSPDGATMYLSVGSGSNVALDMSPAPFDGGIEGWKKTKPLGATWDTEERRADVLRYTPDGKGEKIFATGLRNCAGMTIQPATGALWCVVNERDGLGDNLPFEYATRVSEGKFYGWPWYYIGDHEDPRPASKRPDLKTEVTVPDILMQAHSAPLGITFYDGKSFPSEYRGDAFVTMHGSWNRGKRTGYKVVRLLFKDGKPTGEYEDFMTGFVSGDDQVWGRPVGVAVAKDGSLLISEDGNGTLWRISYKPKNSS